jgi:hypothetical protein
MGNRWDVKKVYNNSKTGKNHKVERDRVAGLYLSNSYLKSLVFGDVRRFRFVERNV